LEPETLAEQGFPARPAVAPITSEQFACATSPLHPTFPDDASSVHLGMTELHLPSHVDRDEASEASSAST
jgi:hypothetical protein